MSEMTKNRITASVFFALPQSNTPLALIDGEVIEIGSPVPAHQEAVVRLVLLISQLTLHLGGKVFVAPLDVYFDLLNIPQPDVMWVAPDSKCQIGEKRLIGAPDLIAEVLSPGTALQDKRDKFRLYEKYGVREYWIVDPMEKLVEVWQHSDGRFVLLNVYGLAEVFNSPLLGEVHTSRIWS
jgi:Uma2 family endonuclease